MVQKLEQGSIVFIDVPAQFPDLSSSKVTLLPLLDLIRRSIGAPHKNILSLLIFDELALFQWVGHSEWDVSRFARALVSSCAKASAKNLTLSCFCLSYWSFLKKKTSSLLQNNVFLAIRYHIAAPDDLDNTVRILLQLSAYHVEVLPLSSGKSGAVSGEVRIEFLVVCSAFLV